MANSLLLACRSDSAIEKEAGQMLEPWTTLALILRSLDTSPSNLVVCALSSKYETIQLYTQSIRSSCSYLSNSVFVTDTIKRFAEVERHQHNRLSQSEQFSDFIDSSNKGCCADPIGLNAYWSSKMRLEGGSAFSSVASDTWNKLPCHLSSISALPAFRKRLKHHLFLSAFPGVM